LSGSCELGIVPSRAPRQFHYDEQRTSGLALPDNNFSGWDSRGDSDVLTVRSSVLTGYADLARSLMLQPEQLVDVAGLPRAALQEPDLRLSALRVIKLLELSASEAGVEDFGVRLGETRRLSNLGLIGAIASEARTARRVALAFSRYIRLHSDAVSVRLDRVEADWLMTMSVAPQLRPVRQAAELAITVLHRAFRDLFGQAWQPDLVCFAHPAPQNLSSYRRVFGHGLQFDAVATGFVCSEAVMDGSRAVKESLLAREARAHLDSLLAQTQPGTIACTRDIITWLLPAGLCSAEAVSERLGLERRTLHRHLAREGKTYASLVEEVREDMARQHLSTGRRPLKELAAALGFEAQSGLSRWCRARFGCSATEWSRSVAQAGAREHITPRGELSGSGSSG
jgi:AraC-like DNA-binding protein